MNKMLEGNHSEADDLEVKQVALEGELQKPEGERTFMGRIEEIVAHLSRVISEGRAGPKIRGSIEKAMREMEAIEGNFGENTRKAKLIRAARGKFGGLLKKMGYND